MPNVYISQEEALRRIAASTGVNVPLTVTSLLSSPSAVPLTLSMPEACALLRVCRDLVREMIKDGRLKGSKVGRDWRILASSVAELLGITPAP